MKKRIHIPKVVLTPEQEAYKLKIKEAQKGFEEAHFKLITIKD